MVDELFLLEQTSTRTLETVADEKGVIHAGSGWTQIFIYPGIQV